MMNSVHAVITGASGNLGKATVRKFLEAGYRVSAIISPGSDTSFMVAPDLKVYRSDLFNEQETEKVISEIIHESGRVSLGVMIAGGFAPGSIRETDSDRVKSMFDLNFFSAYHTARPLFRHMEGTGGMLVLIGARPALDVRQGTNMMAYTLAKSLLLRLAEIINEDGKEKGIKAAVIIPGIIDTPRNREDMADADFSKWVTPGQVADNIAWLVTQEGKESGRSVIEVYGEE